jgi:ribonuclease P protein component
VVVLTLEGPSALPRIGIVAGKRVGNAVSRNRAKRLLREAAAQAELQAGTDYILIADPDCYQTPISELIKAISRREDR